MTFPSRDALIFCNTLYSECIIPRVEEYTITFPKPKPAPTPRAVGGRELFKMVHIRDIHVDLSYDPGTSYNCTYEICCRADTNYTSLGSRYQAGPFGNHYCDSPLSLEESIYAAIVSMGPDHEFTFFTGDLDEGAEWQLTSDEISNDMLAAIQKDIDSDYEYIDCKADGEHNAGVFMRRGSAAQLGAPLR